MFRSVTKKILHTLFVIGLFAGIGFIIYSHTYTAPFIFDDIRNISNNPFIRVTDFSIDSLRMILNSPLKYRPVANFSFALNYYFHQYGLFGYHFTNIIIHIITGILIFFLFKSTLIINEKYSPARFGDTDQPFIVPLLSALIWLVHPINTQSVTYVVQRMTSLATMFYLLSLLFYVTARNHQVRQHEKNPEEPDKSPIVIWLCYTGSFVSGICALASKEISATLPFFVLLYEWFFFQNFRNIWSHKQIRKIFILVILTGLVISIFIGVSVMDKILSLYDHQDFNLFQRVLSELRIVIYYISLFIFPHPWRLNLDHDVPLSFSLTAPVTTLLAGISIVLIICFIFRTIKRHRLVAFAILWYFGNLVIESSIIPLALIFEHRTYLPFVMVALATVYLIFEMIKPKWIPIFFLVCIICLFSFWSHQRNIIWQNELSLWNDCVKKSPNLARPNYNIGNYLKDYGRTNDSISYYKKAITIDPQYKKAYNNLGEVLLAQNNFETAIFYFKKALAIDEHYSLAYINIGKALAKQGNIEKAIFYTKKGLVIAPTTPSLYANLGGLFLNQNKVKEAIAILKKGLRIDPNNYEIQINLGNALLRQGQTEEAVNYLNRGLNLNSNDIIGLNNLGNALTARKQFDQALIYFQKALTISPENPIIHYNIGNTLIQQNRYEEALTHLSKTLKKEPMNIDANIKKAIALSSLNRTDDAIHQYEQVLGIQTENAQAHNNLGILLIRKKKYIKAKNHFLKALQINPADTNARKNLSRLKAMKVKNIN